MTDPFRDSDAAYVLGALSPDDRRAFERHLATCTACATAVAELAGMPGILGALDRDEAVALLAVPEMPPRGPDVVRRLATSVRRRRLRTRVLAAAGALVVAGLLVAGGIAIGTPPAPSVAAVQMDEVRPGIMTADLRVTQVGWGTRFDWSCTYQVDEWDEPVAYALVVTDDSGAETTVATWSAVGQAAKGLVASSSVPTSTIRSVEIRLADSGTTLLRTDL